MEEHYRIKYSIIWKTSSWATKKRIKVQLNCLAFDAYADLHRGSLLLNRYVEEVGIENNIEDWRRAIGYLVQANLIMKFTSNN
jgi:hypothetical protein